MQRCFTDLKMKFLFLYRENFNAFIQRFLAARVLCSPISGASDDVQAFAAFGDWAHHGSHVNFRQRNGDDSFDLICDFLAASKLNDDFAIFFHFREVIKDAFIRKTFARMPVN